MSKNNRKFGLLASSLANLSLLVLSGCDAPDASSLTHPPIKGIFPIYVSIPGNHPGEGEIYKVPEPAAPGEKSVPELILQNLDYPTGLQVLSDGGFYFTEALSGTAGKISQYIDDSSPIVEIATGLNKPVGLVIDTAEQMFVVEKGAGSISRIDGAEAVVINDQLSSPNSLTRDSSDNMFVVESGVSQLTKVLSNGTTEIVSEDLSNPVGGGAGLLGASATLVQGVGLATGKVIVTRSDGATEDFLTRLVMPTALAWEDGTVLLVAEGAPTFQIIQYSIVTKTKNIIATFSNEIATLAMTPLE